MTPSIWWNSPPTTAWVGSQPRRFADRSGVPHRDVQPRRMGAGLLSLPIRSVVSPRLMHAVVSHAPRLPPARITATTTWFGVSNITAAAAGRIKPTPPSTVSVSVPETQR